MIPDQYWQLARRWFWLIALFGILGGGAGLYVLPKVMGPSSAFDSSATLAVSQQIPLTGLAPSDLDSRGDLGAANYAESLAAIAGTPQFIIRFQEELAAQGIVLGAQAIKDKIKVSANPTLLRIEVRASTDSRLLTEALVTGATDLLIARAVEDETRISAGLIANLEQRREELMSRLETLQQPPTVAAPDPFLVDLEIRVISEELEELTKQREQLRLNQTFSLPLVVVTPPETVATEARTLSPRDLFLFGTLGGLAAGWGAANLAERIRLVGRSNATGTVVQTDVIEAYALNHRLLQLAERASRIERRAKALAPPLAGTSGYWPGDTS